MGSRNLSRHISRIVPACGFLAVVGAAITATPVSAADLDPGYAEMPVELPQQTVSFGSGWYIRGDIGASRLPQLSIGNPSSLPTRANPDDIPSAPNPTVGQSSHYGYVASVGAGYQLNNWVRFDLNADFHQPLKTSSTSGNSNVFCITGVSYPNMVTSPTGGVTYGAPSYANGGCTGNYKATLNSYDVMANGYVDLGTWSRITPYVGAGIGLSFGHYQSSATYVQANNVPYQITYVDPQYGTFAPNYDRNSSGQYYNVAFALMAGFAVDVYAHTKLDIGYRYLNLGSVQGLNGTLSTQEVRAGLRYMIDN